MSEQSNVEPLVRVEPWIDALQVRLVYDLPESTGGAVVRLDDRGTRWVLLDPTLDWVHPVDINSWTATAAEFIDNHYFLSAAKVAEQHGVTLEEARGSYWLTSVVWWDHVALSDAS